MQVFGTDFFSDLAGCWEQLHMYMNLECWETFFNSGVSNHASRAGEAGQQGFLSQGLGVG